MTEARNDCPDFNLFFHCLTVLRVVQHEARRHPQQDRGEGSDLLEGGVRRRLAALASKRCQLDDPDAQQQRGEAR